MMESDAEEAVAAGWHADSAGQPQLRHWGADAWPQHVYSVLAGALVLLTLLSAGVLGATSASGAVLSNALVYFDESGAMTAVAPDGQAKAGPNRRVLAGGNPHNIGVPSPDGKFVAWIFYREHNGDFMGVDFVNLANGKWIKASESQVEWLGWSADSSGAYFRDQSQDVPSRFDAATGKVGPGTPDKLAKQQVPQWGGGLANKGLESTLLRGVAARRKLVPSSVNPFTQLLTVQYASGSNRLAFSTVFSPGEDRDGRATSLRYDVWTADADGRNVRWVAHGYGPMWVPAAKVGPTPASQKAPIVWNVGEEWGGNWVPSAGGSTQLTGDEFSLNVSAGDLSKTWYGYTVDEWCDEHVNATVNGAIVWAVGGRLWSVTVRPTSALSQTLSMTAGKHKSEVSTPPSGFLLGADWDNGTATGGIMGVYITFNPGAKWEGVGWLPRN